MVFILRALFLPAPLYGQYIGNSEKNKQLINKKDYGTLARKPHAFN